MLILYVLSFFEKGGPNKGGNYSEGGNYLRKYNSFPEYYLRKYGSYCLVKNLMKKQVQVRGNKKDSTSEIISTYCGLHG